MLMRYVINSLFPFSKTEYDCEDATCINAALRCNGVKNCKFGWDEESCGDISGDFMKLFAKTHVVSIIVVLAFIMIGMVAGMLEVLILIFGSLLQENWKPYQSAR